MAVETVRQLGDPFLREACKEVEQASAPETGALVFARTPLFRQGGYSSTDLCCSIIAAKSCL